MAMSLGKRPVGNCLIVSLGFGKIINIFFDDIIYYMNKLHHPNTVLYKLEFQLSNIK